MCKADRAEHARSIRWQTRRRAGANTTAKARRLRPRPNVVRGVTAVRVWASMWRKRRRPQAMGWQDMQGVGRRTRRRSCSPRRPRTQLFSSGLKTEATGSTTAVTDAPGVVRWCALRWASTAWCLQLSCRRIKQRWQDSRRVTASRIKPRRIKPRRECQLRGDNPGPVGKADAAGGHERAQERSRPRLSLF